MIDWPLEIENDKEFEIKVKIDNNDDIDREIDIWSYIYRGSKSYSGERELNLKHLTLKRGASKEIILKHIVREAEPGDYSLMVKIIKDNQATYKKITQKIKVIEEEVKQEKVEEKEEKIELKEKDKEDYSTLLESTRQPSIVYESTTIKANKLVVWFFIGLLVIYAGILTWKK